MPAETHTNREAVDAHDVLDLVAALVGADDAVGRDTPLGAVGLDEELAVLDLWAAVTEELAERTVAELDVEDLMLARTVGELSDAIVRALGLSDPSGS